MAIGTEYLRYRTFAALARAIQEQATNGSDGSAILAASRRFDPAKNAEGKLYERTHRKFTPAPVTIKDIYKNYDPDRGVPLESAHLFFGLPPLMEEFELLEGALRGMSIQLVDESAFANDMKNLRAVAIRHRFIKRCLRRVIHHKLAEGTLIATAFRSDDPPDAQPSPVDRNWWRTLRLVVERSEAMNDNVKFIDVVIFPCASDKVRSRRSSPASQKKWYRKWIALNKAQGAIPTRDEDLAAAELALGPGTTRLSIRKLRAENAPDSWTRKGRRPAS